MRTFYMVETNNCYRDGALSAVLTRAGFAVESMTLAHRAIDCEVLLKFKNHDWHVPFDLEQLDGECAYLCHLAVKEADGQQYTVVR